MNNDEGFLLKKKKKSKLDKYLEQVSDSVIVIEKAKINLQLEELYSDKKMSLYRYKVAKEN